MPLTKAECSRDTNSKENYPTTESNSIIDYFIPDPDGNVDKDTSDNKTIM